MTHLFENLKAGDLRDLVKPVFEIDSYKSKIGRDEDVIVLSFSVVGEEPAKDIENFVEMGYNFVLDADVSPGETDDGKYRVFVEFERSRHAADQILEVVDGLKKLTNLEQFKFRYFKSFKSYPCTIENLIEQVPTDKELYSAATQDNFLENYSNFFANSFVDNISTLNESIVFSTIRKESLKFNVLASGTKQQVYNEIKGPIMLESKDIAESLFLTKYIGNFNITKISNAFIFENQGYAVALERL